jgi:copper chaperone CopZ
MAEITLLAPAIHCDGCANAIHRSLGRLAGVEQVAVDVAAKSVAVRYDAAVTTPDAISARLEAAGFPTTPAG